MWGWAGKFNLHEVHPNIIWDTPLKFNIDFNIKNSHIWKKIDFLRPINFKFRWCMYLHVWNLKPPQNASCFYLWRSLNIGSCKFCQSIMDDAENSSCKYSNMCNFQPKCLDVVWNRTKNLSIASGADSLQTYQHVHQCGWGGRMNFTSSSIQNHFKLCSFFCLGKKRRWKDGKTSQISDFTHPNGCHVPKIYTRNAGYLFPSAGSCLGCFSTSGHDFWRGKRLVVVRSRHTRGEEPLIWMLPKMVAITPNHPFVGYPYFWKKLNIHP